MVFVGIGLWIVESFDLLVIVFVCNDKYWGEKLLFFCMELKVVLDELVCVNGFCFGDFDVIGGDWVVLFFFCWVCVFESDGMKVVVELGMVMMLFGFFLKLLMVVDKVVCDVIMILIDCVVMVKVFFEGFVDFIFDLFLVNVLLFGICYLVFVCDVVKVKFILIESGWIESGDFWLKNGVFFVFDFFVFDEFLLGLCCIVEMI